MVGGVVVAVLVAKQTRGQATPSSATLGGRLTAVSATDSMGLQLYYIENGWLG